jgi:hypothetical protein
MSDRNALFTLRVLRYLLLVVFVLCSFSVGAQTAASQSQSSGSSSAGSWMTGQQYRDYARTRTQETATKQSSQPAVKAQPTPTSRRTYRRTTTSARKPGAPARPSCKIEPIKIAADPNACILYLDPMDVIARKGEEFATKLMVSNPKALPFKHVFVALHYDPEAVRPLKLDEASLKDALSSPSLANVYESKGLLIYEAQLKDRADFNGKALLDIHWRALGNVRSSEIRFVEFNGYATSLSLGGVDILGDPFIAGDGVVGTRVSVLAPGETAAEVEDFGTEFYGAREILAGAGAAGGISLELRGAKTKVKVGERFFVDVYYNNPLKARADAVNLLIRFNPEVLQVLDHDEDNWITSGVNIFDGAYHERFPFDYFLSNDVDNVKGEIVYRMGASNPDVLSGSGTLATIQFRAKATSEGAMVSFVLPKKPGALGTSVEYLGQDVLGDVADHRDGTRNLALVVGK